MGTILEPSVIAQVSSTDETEYLKKENYLSEFETEDEKSVARENLGVYPKETVYTQDEAELMVNEKIHSALEGYVSNDELPKAVSELSESIANEGYVKSDGSVPFTNPQSQSSLPTSNEHLANKLYVDNTLAAHVSAYDPHKTLDQVAVLLADYAKLADTYTASSLYTKKEIDSMLSDYVLRDGSRSFTGPVIGQDPTLPGHLATMRYVKLVMQNHNSEADPHGFLATLKKYLSNYYTKSETYTKAQTYSRTQLLDIVKSQMQDVVDQAIATYVANEGSVSELRDYVISQLALYVKADGSISHTAPQPGVDAENDNEFVTLGQVDSLLEKLENTVSETVSESTNQTVWKTSGPVETTVGFVEEGTQLPAEMTVQQICDAIFYGTTIGILAPKYAEYGEQVCIKIYTHGLGILSYVELYKNGESIGTLYPSDFDSSDSAGSYYEFCDTGEFTEDTEWKADFVYSDGTSVSDSATTVLAYPVFIAAVPYWWNAQEDVTMSSLRKLAEEDPDNCHIYTNVGPDLKRLKASFDFTDASLRSILVVVPYDYPDLSVMQTPTQLVESSAFAKWVQPMYPNDTETGVLYKIYVFNQALVTLDQTVKFTFSSEEESDE